MAAQQTNVNPLNIRKLVKRIGNKSSSIINVSQDVGS